jgi:hypothetical protein
MIEGQDGDRRRPTMGGTPRHAGPAYLSTSQPPSDEAAETSPELARSNSEVEAVGHPSRVIRLATMAQALLIQVEKLRLDDAARHRLALVFNRTVDALRELLSEDVQQEVDRLELHLPDDPTDAELRVAQAQLVGWLEGLFHGIRTAMLAHEHATRAELSDAYRQGLEAAQQDHERRPPGHYL